MTVNMTRRFMPSLILIYMALIVMMLPRFFYNIPDYLREFISSLGLVMMVGGVVWILFDKFERRLESLLYERIEKRLDKTIELLTGPLSKEINEMKMVRGEDLSSIIRSYYGIAEIKIMIDVRSVGRWSEELIENLAFKLRAEKTRLLITGYEKSNEIEDSKRPESEFFFHQLNKITQNSKSCFDIRVCNKSSSNTIITSQYNITLIIPFDIKGKFLLCVDAKSNSEFLENYQRYFDELWQQASEYSA